MSADTVERPLLLSLGWLFGLLSPAIVEAIKRSRENQKVRVALAAELNEVSYRLALANHILNSHFGIVNRSHLEWFKDVTADYAGPSLVPSSLPAVEVQLQVSEAQLAKLVASQKAPNHQSVNLQKIIVPLLDARVSSVWYLENHIQVLLLDIRSQINLLNEIVDQARYYSGLTFGKLEGGNYPLVVENLKGCQQQYAERAKQIVAKIRELRKAQ